VDLRISDVSLVGDLITSDEVLKKSFEFIDLELQKSMIRRKLDEEPGRQMYTLTEDPENDPSRFPAPSSSKAVVISAYAESVSRFYLRFKEESEEVRKFVLKVNSLHDDLVPLRLVFNDTAINLDCIARYNNRLYRSSVVQVQGNLPNNHVVVQFMETGERITVNANKLFKLPHPFKSVPPFAKQFKLESFKPLYNLRDDQIEFMFRFLTKNKVLQAVICENASDIPSCRLFVDGFNVGDKIKTWDPFFLEYPSQPKLDTNIAIPVTITSGNSPEKFFVTVKSKAHELNRCMELVKKFHFPPLGEINMNSACLVKYDSNIYRGKIISKCISNVHNVHFVDFGNEDEFSANELLTTVDELVKIPPQAYKCVLKGYEDQLVCVDTIKAFESLLEKYDNCEMKMIVVGMEQDSYVVKLIDSTGKSIYEAIEETRIVKETKEDWTEPVSLFGLHFANCANMNKNDTIHARTLTESPARTIIDERTREYIFVF
jgi:hypothetical protein